ncbi:MAG: alanine racemase [Acidiferrobacterales bacterium]
MDLAALQHNFKRVSDFAPHLKIMAVIKADGYGHGILRVAKSLSKADAFAVASTEEGLILRNAGINKPIFLLTGFHRGDELSDIQKYDLTPVIHNHEQLSILADRKKTTDTDKVLNIWCKLDTGMHRVGFDPDDIATVQKKITDVQNVNLSGIMSHLANADNVQDNKTDQQISLFKKCTKSKSLEKSLANSAGIVAWQKSHFDWLRPGIMLFGSSPLLDKSAADLDLLPVMTLESEIINIKKLRKHETIGYGGDWTCPEDMSVAVVAIGYGDGYPRSATTGTPVAINGKRSQVLGRVSMDMITVDLRGIDNARVGDPVELWGQNIPIDEIAMLCNTIAYELMCQVTPRVPRISR